jgi:menaquinone-dependent protoporphyrinogen oxidase
MLAHEADDGMSTHRGRSVMKVLIAYASKHGSTQEIANAIAEELRASRLDVETHDVDEVKNTGSYGALVLGSAIYMGNWLPEARRFVERHAAKLPPHVWLFSSGPLGDPPIPKGGLPKESELLRQTHAHGHRTFAGELDLSELGLAEKLITKAVKAPAGDYRDWDAIRRWAREIASALRVEDITIERSSPK